VESVVQFLVTEEEIFSRRSSVAASFYSCVFSVLSVSNLAAVAPYLLSPCGSPEQAATSFTFDPATK
jgi:hypothetical protein